MSAVDISVLMSVRNGLPYVRQTVESVIAQTFADWEFVIVDNASADATAHTIEEIARREPRIRFLRSAEDLGHSGGLNMGLAACRGRWVARIDADDVALPERLERQVAFLGANPDVAVASCLAYYIDRAGRRAGRTFHDLATREDFRRYMAEDRAIGILHPGSIYDRELAVRIGGYRPAFDPANDIDLWGRFADAGATILVQQERLMEYRVHGGSISSHSFRYARIKYQWARDSMRARRRGEAEPEWEAYVAAREGAPWWTRMNRWRKTNARRMYRQSAENMLSRRRVRGTLEMGAAAVLQPGYTLPRLRKQLL